MAPQIFWALLVSVFIYAMLRGQAEHKIAVLACALAAVMTVALLSPLGSRYGEVEIGVLIVDLGLLAVFLVIALRSQRFWPLWVAGLHLTSSMSHIIKASRIDLLPQVYAAAEKFWSYPILLIIGIAVWRFGQRSRDGLESKAMPV